MTKNDKQHNIRADLAAPIISYVEDEILNLINYDSSKGSPLENENWYRVEDTVTDMIQKYYCRDKKICKILYTENHPKLGKVEKVSIYDARGNCIYITDSIGTSRVYMYDNSNNLTSIINTEFCFKCNFKYDANGNKIHMKDSNDYEEWFKYDANGNKIYMKDSTGCEKWFKYDKKGKLIHVKDSNGYEEWNEYDENGNLIHFKDSDGYEKWNEYDEHNNLIHLKNLDGYEEWLEYDKNNNLIHLKNSCNYEEWFKYDACNNLIYYKNSNDIESWYNYDEHNNIIHYTNSQSLTKTWEYVYV